MTPESRAIARTCTFSRASARTSARQTASYGASICSVYGPGGNGATYGRAQPASPASPRSPRTACTRRRAIVSAGVVIDPAVRLDEPDEPPLVELLELLDAGPGGDRDAPV